MILANLPAWQVALPLLSAPFCLILRKPALVWIYSLFVTLATLVISIGLLDQVLDAGVISYHLGGWLPPWGIEYRIDELNAFVMLIISIIGMVVMLYAGRSIARELPLHKQPLFYVAYLLCLAGLLGISITGDAFNVFVFLEISSLSSYILISLGSDRRALTAAFQYLIMGTLGATFILIGIGLMYVMTGTLNMIDLAERLPGVADTRTIQSAFAFLTVGICLKLALFPLHLWLPNSYAYAPSAASAFLAATATKVSIYVLLRFVFTIFGAAYAFGEMPLGAILLALSICAVLAGSTVAIYQDNIKRMLAWSSIAQIGYIIMGISLASVTGVTAGVLHLFNHALIKGGMFLALGNIVYSTGGISLDNLRGLGKSMPWTMAALVAGGLGLIGIPLTAGFVSKWYLVLAVIEKGWWPILIVILIGSLLSVIYIWRLIEAAWFCEAGNIDAPVREAPFALLAPTWILILASIWFGIDTDITVTVAGRAARLLLGVSE